MKKFPFFAAILLLACVSVADAQVWVNPYTRRDGTFVPGHYRSNPDGNPYNNWSFPGNVNPYTGREATGDLNRYLERYQNRNNFGLDSYNQYPYQFNPYQRRW